MIERDEKGKGEALHAALLAVFSKRTVAYFSRWRDNIHYLRQVENDEKAANSLWEARQVMRTSIRGERTMTEQETIGKFLNTITCIPKLSANDMSLLSNNIECLDCTGRTLIFLQGDFGACFYIIASGTIDLYLESSKDKEMSNCRNFGVFRGCKFDLEKCSSLGRHIATLRAGQGFGEYAILSSTHKFRGASAVASDDICTMLFIVNADTYNSTLRKHHFRQQQMSSAVALLKELPIFNFQSSAKIAQFAYNLQCQTYTSGTVIAKSRKMIRTLFLINSGSVKVVVTNAGMSGSGEESVGNRRANLSALEFGRGQIVGLWEVLKGLDHYEMSYVANASCEIFEISRQYFEEVMSASKKITLPSSSVPVASTRATSSKSNEKALPVFSFSKKPCRHKTYPSKPCEKHTDKSGEISFFTKIQKATEKRESIHYNRIDRVNETLSGSKYGNNQVASDLQAVVPLLTPPFAPTAPCFEKDSKENQYLEEIRAEDEYTTPLISSKGNSSVSFIKQYQNATFHYTALSSTTALNISQNYKTKEIDMSRDFVKSWTPMKPTSALSKSRASPNKTSRCTSNRSAAQSECI